MTLNDLVVSSSKQLISIMKKSIVTLAVLATLFLALPAHIQGQDSGTITYEKVVDFGLKPNGNARWDNFIADLPKKGTFVYVLSFARDQALFQEDPTQREEQPPTLRRALNGVKLRNEPKPEIKQIFMDFDKGEKTEQLEFMTRSFLVKEKLNENAWKITTNKKKVLDYVCFGAEMQVEGGTITAWFTSEIPVSAGPDGYHGLPGMILGVEKEGTMLVLASKVELNPPSTLNQPSGGQKMSREAFEKTVKEKVKEWKDNPRTSDRRG